MSIPPEQWQRRRYRAYVEMKKEAQPNALPLTIDQFRAMEEKKCEWDPDDPNWDQDE